MANAFAPKKPMALGEGGLALAMAALALLSIVVAAKAYTPEFAFHAYLFTAARVAAVFAIINRYYERPAEQPPLTIDGKPNYNMGPVKFATVAAMFWGIAGFTIGLYIASELAYPILNLDLPWTTFGRLRPLHTSAVIFAFGGNGATDERADIDWAEVQVTTAGLEALQRESVVDQACQPAALASEPAGIELALLLGAESQQQRTALPIGHPVRRDRRAGGNPRRPRGAPRLPRRVLGLPRRLGRRRRAAARHHAGAGRFSGRRRDWQPMARCPEN